MGLVSHVPPPGASGCGTASQGFVAYLNHRYAWDYPQQIPMCWAFHGGLVEELTTLYWSRWAAFSGPDASPDKAQAWHTYYLPPFYSRLATWCGGPQHLSKCQSGNHEPARQHEGRTGQADRWAQLTEQLREDDEDDRPAETIGWAQTGEPAAYPPSGCRAATPGPVAARLQRPNPEVSDLARSPFLDGSSRRVARRRGNFPPIVDKGAIPWQGETRCDSRSNCGPFSILAGLRPRTSSPP